MELDDLKNSPVSPHDQAAQQQLFSGIIDRMTAAKYNSTINRIAYPEIAGSIICLMAVIYIAAHFHQLDSLYLKATGVLSIAVLLALSAISFISLQQLKMKGDPGKPYAVTLRLFATRKMQFYRLQKINITLSYLLLVTVIVLMARFFNGRDITGSNIFWISSFSIGYLFLTFFSGLVKRYYKNSLKQTEELLQALQP